MSKETESANSSASLRPSRRDAYIALYATLVCCLCIGAAWADIPASLTQSAAAGDPSSLFDIGDRYENASGVAQDFERAAKFFTLAAVRGSAKAQYRLGVHYAFGLGLAKDVEAGYAWLSLAAAADPPTGPLSDTVRALVASNLSAEQLQRAEQRAAHFAPQSGPAQLPPPTIADEPSEPTAKSIAAHIDVPLCGSVRITSSDNNGYGIEGYVPHSAYGAAIAPAGSAYFERHGIDITLAAIAQPLCDIMNVLSGYPPEPAATAPYALRNETGRATRVFEEGRHIVIDLEGQTEARYVSVDYFLKDGLVLHMFPSASAPDDRIAPGVSLTLGDGSIGGQIWEAGPPFGYDVLVVVSTKLQVFSSLRTELEPSDVYLAALVERLEALRKNGDTVEVYTQPIKIVAR